MSIFIEVLVVVGLSILIVTHKGWVRAEVQVLHNRLDNEKEQVLAEVKSLLDEVKRTASNAKGIASNALSSAQRAEDRVVKHVESVNKQVSEVITSVKAKV